MDKNQEDIVWPTIMEVGGIIIGLAIMVGGVTQIYKRFHAHNRSNIAIFIEKTGTSKQKPHSKKPKDS